jgi:benzoate/toluate 1,2-dioxygenase beta subunit
VSDVLNRATPLQADLQAEMAHLVAHEARLLDDRQFDAWLAMFAEDCRYWVPVSPEQTSPREGVSHFHDDKQILMARTHRLLNPRSFGAEPAPRTCHVVSGVRVEEMLEDGTVVVSSSQLMLEYRRRDRFELDQRMFGGRVTHKLRPHGDGWLIAEKRVDLINADGPFDAMYAPL